MLELADQPSHAETIYESMIGSLGAKEGESFDVSEGTRAEATIYAQAMAFAEARYLLEHAGLQIDPAYVDEMMADREREYGIIPGPNDSMPQRRAVLAARKLLPRGARREAIEDGLRTILGSNFVCYRTTTPAEIANWPATLGAPQQNLQLPATPRKLLRITHGISIGLGAPQAVQYTTVDPVTDTLLVGDHLLIGPEIPTSSETVRVTAVGGGTFTALFNQAHEVNCFATTAPWPMWTGTQRASIVAVKSAVAVDPETRRKVNDFMKRAVRGVSTWAIVETTAAKQIGPFKIGQSPLGATPLGTLTLPIP
jgi:hypothetical protein